MTIVIRQAFGHLMMVIVGCLPATLGIMSVGMFLFGCIAIQSMVNLSKVFLNVTLWDMIAGVYQLFTGGSETCRYSILDFVYLPMTAMAM